MEQDRRQEIREVVEKIGQNPEMQELAKKLDITPTELLRRAIQYYKFSLYLQSTPEAQERLKLMGDEGLDNSRD